MKQKQKLYCTAIHEAGHAVAELKFGENLIKSVTIVPGKEYLGKMISRVKTRIYKKLEVGVLSASDEKYFKIKMIVYMAGPGAEAKFLKRKYFSRGARGDMQKIVELSYEIFCHRKVVEKYIDYIIEEAFVLVNNKSHWKAIKEIANELMTHKKLTGKRCKEIYDKSMGFDEFK